MCSELLWVTLHQWRSCETLAAGKNCPISIKCMQNVQTLWHYIFASLTLAISLIFRNSFQQCKQSFIISCISKLKVSIIKNGLNAYDQQNTDVTLYSIICGPKQKWWKSWTERNITHSPSVTLYHKTCTILPQSMPNMLLNVESLVASEIIFVFSLSQDNGWNRWRCKYLQRVSLTWWHQNEIFKHMKTLSWSWWWYTC